ncbi:hypothetical protein KIPB_010692, partial [Kipferlia bialata]|eukprot:g10692.t1
MFGWVLHKERPKQYWECVGDAYWILADAAGAQDATEIGLFDDACSIQGRALSKARCRLEIHQARYVLESCPLEDTQQHRLRGCWQLICNLMRHRVAGKERLFPGQFNNTMFALLHTLQTHPECGGETWQPKDLLLGLTDIVISMGRGDTFRYNEGARNNEVAHHIISHPLFAYLMDPARGFDAAVNTEALRGLILAAINVQYDTECGVAWMPFSALAQGQLEPLIMTLPHKAGSAEDDRVFALICARIVHFYLESDGSLLGEIHSFPRSWNPAFWCISDSVKWRLASLPGDRINGVPSCLVSTLTRCAEECAGLAGED